MPASLDCPQLESWQELLDDRFSPEERERYERHLEACPACQERLDQTETLGLGLRQLGRRLGDPTTLPPDPLLSRFLERLHGEKGPGRAAPVETPDLYFLQPTDREDILGMLGAYEVSEVIGQGGMGVVLKAFDPVLQRPAAIKVMAAAIAGSAVARQRFTREAKAAAAVCHENIVTVYGVLEVNGLPYLVMQYVAGESLQAHLDRRGALEVEDVVRMGLQIASGLAAAHAQGLIHRDIKPANLLLENGLPRVKITDFGLARMTDDVQLTQNGVVTGTPEYMAPEQARGAAIDHRADLYSLGSVLYALCSGWPPFRAATMLAVLQQVNQQAATPLHQLNPRVPEWLEMVIARLMAKDPADRFQSAAEVAALLEGYLVHLRQRDTVPAPPLPPTPGVWTRRTGRLPRLSARQWYLVAGGSVGALGLLAALVLAMLGGADAPAEKPNNVAHEIHYDFRGRPLPRDMITYGDLDDSFIKVEPQGLRFTLPRNLKLGSSRGVSVPLSITGDFEITVAAEFLRYDEPAPGSNSYGVGVLMSVNEKGRIGRLFRADSKQVVTWDRWAVVNDEPKFLAGSAPCSASVVRLRLTRTGSVLHFLWAPGSVGDNFTDFQQGEVGDAEMRELRLEMGVDVGNATGALDFRLLDLTLRSDSLPASPVSATEVVGPTSSADSASSANDWVLAAVGLTGLGIVGLGVVGALAMWLMVRRRRPAKTILLAPVPEPPATLPAPSPLAFSCPHCEKNLRARAELAGKKVKCSQCGKPVPVPGISASAS